MRKLIRDRNLHDIAAAIRTKNGSNGTYKPREMADAIRALPSPSTLISKTITQNGSYSPQSENADGFSSVTVNVGRNLVRKDITRNGSFSAASDHVDGFSSVSVDVPNSYNTMDEGKVVSGGSLSSQTSRTITQNGTFDTTRNNQVTVNVSDDTTLVSKTITANGTYHPADDNADGYSSVSVAVPNSTLSSTDEGKVVVNGALMPQTSLSVTQNGTYDTTDKNSIVVNVDSRNTLDPTGLSMTQYTVTSESSMSVTALDNSISIAYMGGVMIGCMIQLDSIILPQVNQIRYHIEVGTSSYDDNGSERRPFFGVRAQRCNSGWVSSGSSNWLAVNIYNSRVAYSGDEVLDLSNISCSGYLYFGGHGCTAAFSNLEFVYA